MSKSVIIVKLDKRVACVMTKEYEFHYIERKPGMFLGQQIQITDSEIFSNIKKVVKYGSLVAGITALLLVVMLIFNTNTNDGIYAFVNIDFNNSIEFIINDENKVIRVNTADESAKGLILELELKDKPLNVALSKVINRSKEMGLIGFKDNNTVLISASLNCETKEYKQYFGKEEKKLEALLKKISEDRDELCDRSLDTKVLKVDPEVRKKAIENNISMGRYSIYKKAMDLGVKTTMEEIRNGDIADIIEKVYHQKDLGDKKDDKPKVKDNLYELPNSKSGSSNKGNGTSPTPTKLGMTTPLSKHNSKSTPFAIYTPKPTPNTSGNQRPYMKPRMYPGWNRPFYRPTRPTPQNTPYVRPQVPPHKYTPCPDPLWPWPMKPKPTHWGNPTGGWTISPVPTIPNWTMPPRPTCPKWKIPQTPTAWAKPTGDWNVPRAHLVKPSEGWGPYPKPSGN